MKKPLQSSPVRGTRQGFLSLIRNQKSCSGWKKFINGRLSHFISNLSSASLYIARAVIFSTAGN
ncbi:hypothetical protein DAEQUDRAFT_726928 [Daedalea quercina L-15889]|uniref:Uncharacterized protein n=1 Tax=Daedalea quercina L-15889 TaxID=1314783 RepID=A0A165QE93_9APHY|nr:hypothetical protein DAEQUDRAFT_726928 [Daedalea quercina L-15889]